jgi:hypothetical protein
MMCRILWEVAGWIGLTSSLDHFCLSEFDAACLSSNLSAYELKSCKRRERTHHQKTKIWIWIVYLDWIGFGYLFFLFFFFIANARQTSLNPSMNRDQQRREMGGPLVRWRQIIQPSYIQIRLERLNDTLPSSSFYNQQRLCLSFSSTTFRHLTMATFRVGREERPKKNEGSHSSAWLAGSVVLESWCLLLQACCLAGWLTDWM